MQTAQEPQGVGFVRAIGRMDLTAAIVNAILGSAIFSIPSEEAALTGGWSPLAYLLAGLGVLTIVLCFAEVASRFREPGGPYLYARQAFGPFLGFQAGWLTFWIRVTAVAASLNVFVTYLRELLPWAGTPPGRATIMCLVMAVITLLNLVGVRQATWTVDLFTLAKLMPLLVLILVGVTQIQRDVLLTQHVPKPQWTEAILLLVFAYGGFEAPLIPAGEARDPRSDSSFALLLALLLIASLYMLVQWVVIGVVPHVAGIPAPLVLAFRTLLGAPGATLASATAIVSVWGYVTGSVLQTPRVLFAMSERGDLPGGLAHLHPRFRTPDRSILLYASLTLCLGLYGSFAWNATLSAIVRLVTYGLTCAALPILRRQGPSGFRLPSAGFFVPASVAFCLWLLSTRTFRQAWILLAIVLVGSGVFLWTRWRQGGAHPLPRD